MTHQEWMAYLQTLPEAERRKTKEEIVKAVTIRTMQTMVDNLNNNQTAE
jgi:hypothetical protein